jgi:hypothetical protein
MTTTPNPPAAPLILTEGRHVIASASADLGIASTGARARMDAAAEEWNADPARIGPATLRFEASIGWHVTVAPWAGS